MVGKNRHIVCMLFIILIEVNPINVFGYERDTLCLLAGRKAKSWERVDCSRGIVFFKDSTYREYVGNCVWEFNCKQDMFQKKYTEKDGVLKFYYDINPLRAIDSAKIMKLTADSLVLMQYNCRFVFVRSKKKLKRFSYSRPHAK